MKISVIVPTHDPAEGSLERLVGACLEQDIGTANLEILLVFNRANDPARARLPQLPSRARLLVAGRLGVNRARNLGIHAAAGEILLFLDDDCLPASRSFLSGITESLRAAPVTFAGIGGLYVDPENADWSVRGNNLLTRLWIQSGVDPNAIHLPTGNAYSVHQLAGGNMAFRSDVFKERGCLFDESIVSGGDETEMQRRLRAAGHGLLYSPERRLAVIHAPEGRGEPTPLAAVKRAIRHGRISAERPGLRTPVRGGRFGSAVQWARAMDRERAWKDPAALAFLGLHFSSMLAARSLPSNKAGLAYK